MENIRWTPAVSSIHSQTPFSCFISMSTVIHPILYSCNFHKMWVESWPWRCLTVSYSSTPLPTLPFKIYYTQSRFSAISFRPSVFKPFFVNHLLPELEQNLTTLGPNTICRPGLNIGWTPCAFQGGAPPLSPSETERVGKRRPTATLRVLGGARFTEQLKNPQNPQNHRGMVNVFLRKEVEWLLILPGRYPKHSMISMCGLHFQKIKRTEWNMVVGGLLFFWDDVFVRGFVVVFP